MLALIRSNLSDQIRIIILFFKMNRIAY